jgi:hypothetical protein
MFEEAPVALQSFTPGAIMWRPELAMKYCLPGLQAEPGAGKWTEGRVQPHVVSIAKLVALTDKAPSDGADNPFFLPPYPSDAFSRIEVEELLELAALRDDPAAIAGGGADRRRRKISRFLQIRPQPPGAVYNTKTPACEPVIQTGRELARWFESEIPCLGHCHALSYLLRDANWSHVRQARVWTALEVAIQSALLAAWYYKWRSPRVRVSYRLRPLELDCRVDVINATALARVDSGDGRHRTFPDSLLGMSSHPSYPSRQSTVGGAASEILAYFFPEYTSELDDLADNVGMARLWAGVNFRSDHEAGIRLGRAVARLVIGQLEAQEVLPLATP